MSLWPPTIVETEIADWSVADLKRGDLLFCARPGDWVAIADSIAGEEWRHVGAVSRDADGDWAVLETFGNNFQQRKLVGFLECYDSFGVCRFDLASSLVDQATAWMHEQIASDTDHVYAWDDLFLAGIIAATHRHIDAGQRDQLRSALIAGAAAAKDRPEHQGVASLTCSAFVQIAYDTVGGPGTIRHERWRSAPLWPPLPASLDQLFDGPDQEFEAALRHTNLLELFAADELVERGAAGSRVKPSQVWEAVRTLRHAVEGWKQHDPDASGPIGSDGRWVTPGDLWHSPTVAARGYLPKQEALAQLALES